MAVNMLAGSGPSPSTGGNADGPAPQIQGTTGATPQAGPVPQGAPNMLAGGPQGAPGGGQPSQASAAPPSIGMLMEALHKQSYVVSELKQLLSKPDLTTKDVLNSVGEAVADKILGPFDAANYLKDLPPGDDAMALRQWVGQHYAQAYKAFQTVSEMVAAHGQMMRRQAAGQPMPQGPQAPPQGLSNALMQPQAGAS